MNSAIIHIPNRFISRTTFSPKSIRSPCLATSVAKSTKCFFKKVLYPYYSLLDKVNFKYHPIIKL